MAVVMTLTTVQSLSRSWPRMAWYFATWPFCSRKPKTIPVSNPRINWAGDSNMTPALRPVQEKRRRGRYEEGEHDEHPTGDGQLQGAADAVATGASPRQARAEHHDRAAQEGEGE